MKNQHRVVHYGITWYGMEHLGLRLFSKLNVLHKPGSQSSQNAVCFLPIMGTVFCANRQYVEKAEGALKIRTKKNRRRNLF